MTIKNNSLSDILNNFKNNKSSIEDNSDDDISPKPIQNLINSFIVFLVLFIKSFIFGYAIKLLFSKDWVFWEFICIGLSINFLFQFIYSLVDHKYN
jgi:hypothetical protein